MITARDMRKGTTIEWESEIYQVEDYQHSFIGRGSANVRVKLRNLRTDSVTDRTFSPDQRFSDFRLESREVQYLYSDGHLYYFMDTENYDQPALPVEALGNAVNYLQENMLLKLAFYEGEAIEVSLPTTVDLTVTEAPPGYAGDTATGASKQVTVETGLKVQVPLFVAEGDVIRVDTRTGDYLTRA